MKFINIFGKILIGLALIIAAFGYISMTMLWGFWAIMLMPSFLLYPFVYLIAYGTFPFGWYMLLGMGFLLVTITEEGKGKHD